MGEARTHTGTQRWVWPWLLGLEGACLDPAGALQIPQGDFPLAFVVESHDGRVLEVSRPFSLPNQLVVYDSPDVATHLVAFTRAELERTHPWIDPEGLLESAQLVEGSLGECRRGERNGDRGKFPVSAELIRARSKEAKVPELILDVDLDSSRCGSLPSPRWFRGASSSPLEPPLMIDGELVVLDERSAGIFQGKDLQRLSGDRAVLATSSFLFYLESDTKPPDSPAHHVEVPGRARWEHISVAGESRVWALAVSNVPAQGTTVFEVELSERGFGSVRTATVVPAIELEDIAADDSGRVVAVSRRGVWARSPEGRWESFVLGNTPTRVAPTGRPDAPFFAADRGGVGFLGDLSRREAWGHGFVVNADYLTAEAVSVLDEGDELLLAVSSDRNEVMVGTAGGGFEPLPAIFGPETRCVFGTDACGWQQYLRDAASAAFVRGASGERYLFMSWDDELCLAAVRLSDGCGMAPGVPLAAGTEGAIEFPVFGFDGILTGAPFAGVFELRPP